MKAFSSLWALILCMIILPVAWAEENRDSAPDKKKIERLLQEAESYVDIKSRQDEVKKLLKEVEKLDSENPEIYRLRGHLESYQLDWETAEKYYKQWAELDNDNPTAYERLGHMAYEQKAYKRANKYFAEALKRNPTKPYYMAYRCHNFVRLKAWEDAVKECTDAIAINPDYTYALQERAKAYRALGDDEKAKQDIKTSMSAEDAENYHMLSVASTLGTVFLIIVSLAFIAIGLLVLARKKPLLFSSRWMFMLLVLCFFPEVMNSLLLPGLIGSEAAGWGTLMVWMIPVLCILLLSFVWIATQGYMMFGITDVSFKETLKTALERLNLQSEESLSTLRIPSANLTLQVAIQSWLGIGQIRPGKEGDRKVFHSIMYEMGRRFGEGNLAMNNVTAIFYLVIGVIILAFSCVIMGLLHNMLIW